MYTSISLSLYIYIYAYIQADLLHELVVVRVVDAHLSAPAYWVLYYAAMYYVMLYYTIRYRNIL